jgi:hypothetical protein
MLRALPMPEFGDVLTSWEINDLIAYLRARRKVIVVAPKPLAAAPKPAAESSTPD